MDILIIASQKGLASKMTLTAHLAVQAERTGVGPVAVVDPDPQNSLAILWNQHAAEILLFAAADVVRLAQYMAALGRQRINAVPLCPRA